MSELAQAIEEMRNMRESYDQLTTSVAAMGDVQGKIQLAAAISSKGVPASSDDNLSNMAQKVTQIPQQVNMRTSNFEQMIAPTPYMWNVYAVATDLMKDTLPNYLPAYMQQYKQQYGANAFFVGEYYRGYASLELTGADAYLTHDGCFYTIADGMVTRTAPDGTVTTYAAESVVHTWLNDENDTYTNRWVAFFYLADGYGFTNANADICPSRVAICGHCASFVVSGANRLTDVWVIGELGIFSGGTTGTTWNPAQCIRNYKNHTSGAIYTNPSNVVSIILPDMENCSVSPISGSAGSLQVLSLPKNRTIRNLHELSNYPSLTMFFDGMEGTYTLSSGDPYFIIGSSSRAVYHLPNIKRVSGSTGYFIKEASGKELLLDNLEYYSPAAPILFGNSPQLTIQKVYAPKLSGGYFIIANNRVNYLKDVWLGEFASNISLGYWTASSVTSTPEGIIEINANIRNHIAARIKDLTGLSSKTITFGASLYNKLEQATLDAFSAKNWTVASA